MKCLFFSEGSAGRSVEIKGENTVSEENIGEGLETNSDSSSWGLCSSLTKRELDKLVMGYGLAEGVGARLPKGTETARVLAKGYVAIFESQLKLGFRFLVF